MGLKAGLWLWLPWWWDSKETTCNMGDLGSVPGWGRSPGGGHGNPLQYSCMENPMDRGALWAHGAAKSRTQLRNFHFWLWVLSGEYFFSPLISRVATYYKSFHAFLRKFVCLFVSFVLWFFFLFFCSSALPCECGLLIFQVPVRVEGCIPISSSSGWPLIFHNELEWVLGFESALLLMGYKIEAQDSPGWTDPLRLDPDFRLYLSPWSIASTLFC